MCSFLFLRVRHRAIADDLGQDVRLAQDQDLVGAELDLGSAVLGEDDLVTLLDVHLDVLPVLVTRAGTDCEDTAALRLLLRRVGQHDAADGGLFLFEDLHDQTVTERLQVHVMPPRSSDFVTVPGTLYVRVPTAFYKSGGAAQAATARRPGGVTKCR